MTVKNGLTEMEENIHALKTQTMKQTRFKKDGCQLGRRTEVTKDPLEKNP